MPTVSVKWQKEVFPAVEIDIGQPPLMFNVQLYGLTGVPPERQKIMVKGGLSKDDADWSTVGVKDGQRLIMMGTADEIVKAPEKGVVFIEDLPKEEQAVAVGHSAGLFNLGNTCYMNSTLQCLHSVPELKSALSGHPLGKVSTNQEKQNLRTRGSADSGHYVTWVKREKGDWIQFDDDHPMLQKEDDVTKLSGVGDWYMAYICMYTARVRNSNMKIREPFVLVKDVARWKVLQKPK